MKRLRVSTDHYQNSNDKVALTNPKESYQFKRFDNCEQNRQDQQGLVRTQPVKETVNGARNSHSQTLLLTIKPLQQAPTMNNVTQALSSSGHFPWRCVREARADF
jgi:hypothetical protein